MEEPRTPLASRLSVPTVQSLGFAQSFGIKSVCNVSLSSIINNTFNKDKEDQDKEGEAERKNSLVRKTSYKNKLWVSTARPAGGHGGHDGKDPPNKDYSNSPLLCPAKPQY